MSDADMGWFMRTGGLRLLGVSCGLRGVSVCLDQEENGGFAAEWNGPRKTFRLEVCPRDPSGLVNPNSFGDMTSSFRDFSSSFGDFTSSFGDMSQ